MYKLILLLLLTKVSLQTSNEIHDRKNQQGELEKKPLYIISFLPYYFVEYSYPWIRGEDVQPAMELARDQINNSSSLLPNYSLELIFVNDVCQNIAESVFGFIKKLSLLDKQQILGIIGPTCEKSASVIAAIAEKPSVGLVTLHAGDGDSMSGTQLSLGSLFSSKSILNEMVNLIQESEWKDVQLLCYRSDSFYYNLAILLTKQKIKININVEPFTEVPVPFIQNLSTKKKFLETIFVLAPIQIFKKILCLPETRMLQRVQWIYIGQYGKVLTEQFMFHYNGTSINCSRSFYQKALDMSLVITPSVLLTNTSNIQQPMNTSVELYLKDYAKYRGIYNHLGKHHWRKSLYSPFSGFYYDSVWAWAMVLHKLLLTHNHTYKHIKRNGTSLIAKELTAIQFSGMSGKFVLNWSNGSGNKVNLIQFCQNQWINRSFKRMNNLGCPLFYSSSIRLPLKPLEICFLILTAIQIILLSILQVLTIACRKKSSVKAADVILLQITYIGAYILDISSILHISRLGLVNYTLTNLSINMVIIMWLLPTGITLLVSSVTARTWRIHRIVNHPFHPGSIIISNMFILGLIVGFLVLDLILGISATTLIFLVHFGHSDLYLSALIYILIGGLGIIKAAFFLVLILFTIMTGKSTRGKAYSTRLCYLVFMCTFLLFAIVLYYELAFHTPYNLFYASFFEVTIFIIFIFLPPLYPALKSYFHLLT